LWVGQWLAILQTDEGSPNTPFLSSRSQENKSRLLLLAFLRIEEIKEEDHEGVVESTICKTKSLPSSKETFMLYWAVVFFVVALIAAIFGFTGIAVAAAGIAKLLFFIFLVLFVIALITHVGRRGSTI
jgi:uncharacterized membrane protein YtjA (UPF0391 family)